MSAPPPYVVHHVDEKDVTVDWFFGPGRWGTKVRQLVLVVLGWCFVVLPIAVTTSALVHRHDEDSGWWGYREGFVMWDRTMLFLGILVVFFVLAFGVLHLVDRRATARQVDRATYDEERLARRSAVAAAWYAQKYGPATLRSQQTRVVVQPYGDIETYELRGLYRSHGVDG